MLPKEATVRIRDIRLILIEKLVDLLEKNYLLLNQLEIEILFVDWWDSAPVENKSLFVGSVGFIFDGTIFKSSAVFENVTELQCFWIGFMSDTKENAEWFRSQEADLLLHLVDNKFHYVQNDIEYVFSFKLCTGMTCILL